MSTQTLVSTPDKATPADRIIAVVPAAGGWRLETGDVEALMFLSGAKAEARAKALAQAFARTGEDVRVMIHDRSSALVATQRFFAENSLSL